MGKIKSKKGGHKPEVPMVNKMVQKKKNRPGKLLTNDMKKFLSGTSAINVKSVDKKVKMAAENGTSSKVGKAKKKSKPPVSKGDDFPEEMRKELEVFIKNLNRGGEIQKAFVLDDAAVENGTDDGEDDVVSVDGNYEDLDDDFDEKVEIKIEEEEQEVKKEKKVNEDKGKKTKKEKKMDKERKKETERFEVKSEKDVTVKEEKDVKPEFDRADYFFVKEERQVRTRCLLKPKSGEPWYEIVEKKSDVDSEGVETSQYWLMKIEKFAKKLLDEEVANFNAQSAKETKKSSEQRFIETVLKSGTLNDKISAYVVMIQESPVHHLALIQTLIEMVSLKSRRPCMIALDALKNLFANILLVPDRKLRMFGQCPVRNLDKLSGGNKDTRDKYLMIWLFEQNLKTLYVKFLAALAEVGKDTIDKTRAKVMSVILDLLISNPEQEQELLSRLVNKLGDPVRSVAAKATYQIGLLLEKHPAMKAIVLDEIERLLYRPNIAAKAQYYGICCLTQLVLDEDDDNDRKMANKLISIYFSFFKASIKKGEIDSKLVSALLTGVHRAFPFANIDSEVMAAQVETMFKIAHMSNFNIAIHAFMLLFQVMGSGGDSVTDRFYNAYYKKLLSPDLASSSKPALFLNLTYKVLKNDPAPNRVLAFAKRLFHLCSYWPVPLVCGTHFLISEVLKSRPEVRLLNKVDETPADNIEDKLKKFEDEDDEADDYRKDVKLSDDETGFEVDVKPSTSSKPLSSWVHRNLQKVHKVHGSKASKYDPHERNPLFAGAEMSNFWELSTLAEHYHPSAALFGRTLLEDQQIKYTGDPLSDFTTMRFLDRFVFRNPKKDPFKNKPQNLFAKRNTYQAPAGVKRLAPDSKEYVDRDESQVPLDERFIYRFFREKKSRVSDEQDSDAESVNSEDAMEAIEMFADSGTKDLDFAAALEPDQKSGKKKKKLDGEASDDSDSDDDDSLLEEDDIEMSDGDAEVSDVDELIDEDGDDQEPDFEEIDDFEDLDDDFEVAPSKKSSATKKASNTKLKKAQKMAMTSADIFASAEEFSALIDENEHDEEAGGMEQVSNKDRSSLKQMAWERQRHSDFKRPGKFVSKDKFKKKFSAKAGHKKKR